MKKAGRPPGENPKDTLIHVRMDSETINLMDGCAMRLETTRSDVIRTGIKRFSDDVITGRYPESKKLTNHEEVKKQSTHT